MQSGLYFDQRNYSSLRHSKPTSAYCSRVCRKVFLASCVLSNFNTFLIPCFAFWVVRTNLWMAVFVQVCDNWIHIVCVSVSLNDGNVESPCLLMSTIFSSFLSVKYLTFTKKFKELYSNHPHTYTQIRQLTFLLYFLYRVIICLSHRVSISPSFWEGHISK